MIKLKTRTDRWTRWNASKSQGENLLHIRDYHGLSIRRAAVLCGIAPATWHLTEIGRNELRPETIEKITTAIKAINKG